MIGEALVPGPQHHQFEFLLPVVITIFGSRIEKREIDAQQVHVQMPLRTRGESCHGRAPRHVLVMAPVAVTRPARWLVPVDVPLTMCGMGAVVVVDQVHVADCGWRKR